jgi:uncharacterized protein (TIGR02117 family)
MSLGGRVARWAGALACLLALVGREAEAAVPQVVVVSHGWHTGLVVEAAAVHRRLPALQARFPLASHYEIGWGDQDFYPAGDFSVWLAARALWASRGAVLHVVGRPGPWLPASMGAERVTVCLSEAQHDRLLDWVDLAFARQSDGALRALGPGLYGDSQFYRATGHYSLAHNCNHWTAQALAAGGVAVPSGAAWTAGRVLQAMRGHSCINW